MLKKILPFLLISFWTCSGLDAGFITIDDFSNFQSLSVYGTDSGTSTVSASGSLGGYRTFSINSVVNDNDPESRARLRTFNNLIGLSSDALVEPAWSIKWAGASGTGFTPTNFIDTPSGINSELRFTVLTSDHSGTFNWTLTDTSGKLATYSVNIQSSLTSVDYAARFVDFNTQADFDWEQVKAVELKGSGVEEWDYTMTGSIITAVPEPSFISTLLATAIVFSSGIRRRAPRQEDLI